MKKILFIFLIFGQILNAQTFQKPVTFEDKVVARKSINVYDSIAAKFLNLKKVTTKPTGARVNTVINYNDVLQYWNGAQWIPINQSIDSVSFATNATNAIYSDTSDYSLAGLTSIYSDSAITLQGWDTTYIKALLALKEPLITKSPGYLTYDGGNWLFKNEAYLKTNDTTNFLDKADSSGYKLETKTSNAIKLGAKADTSLVGDTAYAIRQTVNTKLSSVSHDATLTGTGTALNVLKVDTNLIATKRFVSDTITFVLTGKQDSIGTWDASGNLFPSTDVQKGDWWTITVKGFVGGTDSVFVDDLIIAKINNPGQTTTNWIINSAASVGVTTTAQLFKSSSKGPLYYNGRTPLAGATHGGSAAPIGTSDTLNVNGNLYTSGTFTQKTTPTYESAILGVEKLTGTGWTSTDWTGDYATGFKHTTGNTTALTNTLAAVSGTSYQISFTVTEITNGTFTITFGGQTSTAYSATSAWGPKATTTGNLKITPSSTFDGKIIISIKVISPYPATYILLDNTGAISYEQRNSQASLGNLNQGANAGKSITTGTYNINQGTNAGKSITTGNNNLNQGTNAGMSITTGSNNLNQGAYAGTSITTGYNNLNQGTSAGISITTGSNNLNQGANAGRYIADGVTTRTTGNNGVLIGYDVRASANGTDNEIAIGANAIAVGSNTFMLGNSAITGVYNYGSRYGILGTSNYYNATLGTIATNDKRTSATSTAFNWYNYTSGNWSRIMDLSNTGRMTLAGGLSIPKDTTLTLGNALISNTRVSTSKTFNLPDTSGTIALLSNIGAVTLPITGTNQTNAIKLSTNTSFNDFGLIDIYNTLSNDNTGIYINNLGTYGNYTDNSGTIGNYISNMGNYGLLIDNYSGYGSYITNSGTYASYINNSSGISSYIYNTSTSTPFYINLKNNGLNATNFFEFQYKDVTKMRGDSLGKLHATALVNKYDTLASTATVITYNAAVNPFRTDTIGEAHTYHIDGAVNGMSGQLNVTLTSSATLTFPSGVLADGQTFTSLAEGVYNICWVKVQGTFQYNIKKYNAYTGY